MADGGWGRGIGGTESETDPIPTALSDRAINPFQFRGRVGVGGRRRRVD